ncbi:hypothetical protein CPAV1605_663 [seawater metagenome]|uniref:RING-type domain-containing protein n=1 Tax=seawater metagenome TaxID=1561972 RepID=A0A5E8CHQ4_9ZZZZ
MILYWLYIILFIFLIILVYICIKKKFINTQTEYQNLDDEEITENYQSLEDQNVIINMNTTEYEIANYYYTNDNDDDECVICLEKLNKTNISQLVCLHKYHKECLDNWKKSRTNKIECPQCGK